MLNNYVVVEEFYNIFYFLMPLKVIIRFYREIYLNEIFFFAKNSSLEKDGSKRVLFLPTTPSTISNIFFGIDSFLNLILKMNDHKPE